MASPRRGGQAVREVEVDRRTAEEPGHDGHQGDTREARPPAPASHRARSPGEEHMTAPAAGRDAWSSRVASAPSAFALLAGVWLIVSRLIVDFPPAGGGTDAALNGIVIGIAVGLVALVRMATNASNPVLDLVNLALGAWLIISPWIFGYDQWDTWRSWSDLLAGAVIAAAGLASYLAATRREARRTSGRRAMA